MREEIISSIEAPEGFEVDVNTATLNSNQNLTVTVSFQPLEEKNYLGTIIVNSSNAGSTSISVEAEGAIITDLDFSEILKSVKIIPNPVKDFLILDFENIVLTEPRVYIYDISGVIHIERSGLTFGKNLIDVRDLNQGVYLIRVVGKEGKVVKRFIKQ